MLCTTDDIYVRDRVRWVVLLSNGQMVYQDDDRPGIVEPSAWKRLRNYCIDNEDVYIVKMWVQFRSNRILVEPEGEKAGGYFFCKSALGILGLGESEDYTYHAYTVGAIDATSGILTTTTWKVPELIPLETQTRDIDEDSPMVILKNFRR